MKHKILIFIFFCQLNINENKYIEQILFYFYVTYKYTKKMVYILIFSFFGQNEKGNEKNKNGKKIDPPPLGFEPWIFEQNFPA